MNVAILPTQKSLLNDNIFNPANARDNVLERFALVKQALKDKGHTCNTLDQFDYADVDVLILSRFDSQLRKAFLCIKKNPCIKFILTANEPWIICPMHTPKILEELPVDIVFTWNDTAAKQYKHIRKGNIGQPYIYAGLLPAVEFNEKKMCCLIVTNKTSNYPNELYSERLAAVRFFARKNAVFDLFGMGWEFSQDPLVKKVYKGTVVSKKETMQHYKFAICYENVKDEMGLITEKIFDCFAAGCVPVYYGARNVTDYIPKECFIDFRDFADYEDLYSFIMNMEEKEYNKYLNAVKKFLQTDAYKEFTSEAYVRNIMQAIEELKRKKVNRNFYKVKLDLMWYVIKNMGFYLRNQKRTRRFVCDVVTVW
ncbi:MAG: hypothetical protein JRE47_12495 [Deltaproteobacteria bacterium]|nr:hypothetical protein [Deltaproteobacteria bacterium]